MVRRSLLATNSSVLFDQKKKTAIEQDKIELDFKKGKSRRESIDLMASRRDLRDTLGGSNSHIPKRGSGKRTGSKKMTTLSPMRKPSVDSRRNSFLKLLFPKKEEDTKIVKLRHFVTGKYLNIEVKKGIDNIKATSLFDRKSKNEIEKLNAENNRLLLNNPETNKHSSNSISFRFCA